MNRQYLQNIKPLGAGLRDREIVIEQLTASDATSGFPVQTWAPLVTVYANKQDMRADERFDANRMSAYSHTRWECDYREDLDPDRIDAPKTRRLVYQGRVYDIIASYHLGRQDGIEFVTLAASAVPA